MVSDAAVSQEVLIIVENDIGTVTPLGEFIWFGLASTALRGRHDFEWGCVMWREVEV